MAAGAAGVDRLGGRSLVRRSAGEAGDSGVAGGSSPAGRGLRRRLVGGGLARRPVRDRAVVVRRSDTVDIATQAQAAAAAGRRCCWWSTTAWAGSSRGTRRRGAGEPVPGDRGNPRCRAGWAASRRTGARHGAAHRRVAPGDQLPVRRGAPLDRHGAGRSTYRPTNRQLARVDVEFRNYRQGKALEFRTDIWRGMASSNQETARRRVGAPTG
ncbi:hypothetical protein NKG94_11885 [Micromonospora sp. M12]